MGITEIATLDHRHVHGFPESWWAFRGVIPILAAEHRVIAVDLSRIAWVTTAARQSVI